jgi:hypothetical protein
MSSTTDPATYHALRSVLPIARGLLPPRKSAHLLAYRPPHATRFVCPVALSSDATRRPQSRCVPSTQPCYSVSSDAAANASATSAYCDLLDKQPDGRVTADPSLLSNLMNAIRDRARTRGSCHVTERDIRDAAQLMTSSPSSAIASPADELPEHSDRLHAELRRAHEAVGLAKSGGGRAPRVLIIGETSGVITAKLSLKQGLT